MDLQIGEWRSEHELSNSQEQVYGGGSFFFSLEVTVGHNSGKACIRSNIGLRWGAVTVWAMGGKQPSGWMFG